MFANINFIKQNKKVFGEIFFCKIAEGFFIVLAAKFLVRFVNSGSPEILAQFLLLLSARFFVANFEEKFFSRLSEIVQTSVRKKLHEEIFRREIPGGELLTLIFDTVKTLDEFFSKVAPHVAGILILLPIFLVCAVFSDLLTAGILFLTLPISPLLLYLIGRTTAEKNSRALAELQKLNGEFRELLAAVTTLKMFGRINAAAAKLKSASEKSSAATLDVLKLAFVSSFALELITTLSIALVAVTLGLRLVSGDIEFDTALFLLLIAPEFFLPLRKIGIAFHVAMSSRDAVSRLKNFFRTESEKKSFVEKFRVPPEISIEKVSFTYPEKKSPALRDINLKIPAGKIVALTGESGSGKSTLLKLLAGINLPTEGEIFFNDLPISKMQGDSLREKISYTPQAPHLFDATLRENFTVFGQLDEKFLPELLTALNLNFPDLNAVQKLSRGQLQRLGLVRALLKNAPLILLDEPTAGLDEVTEGKVLSLLKKFSSRKTILIATHRPAVLNFAEMIVRLEVKDDD